MDLYAVRVVKKDQDKILLKVYEVYQDGEERPPQPDPKFMLSVIAEELGPMNKRLNLLPPLAQEIIRNKPFKNASEWEALSHFTGKLMQLRPLAYITSVVTLEENTIAGGAGSAVNECLVVRGIQVTVRNIGLPDRFVEQGERDELLVECGLDADGVLRQLANWGFGGSALSEVDT